MNLTEIPEVVSWPETHFVFVEKIGPFQQSAPQAWQQVHPLAPAVSEHNEITGYMSLYKIEPDKMTYRAGFAVAAEPRNLPAGLTYERFRGGKYSRFVLTGPYHNLPAASGRVFEIVRETKLEVRDDFCIENYVNDPRTTPEDQVITQILIPTA